MSDVLRAALIEKAKRERARRQGAQASSSDGMRARIDAAKAGTLQVSPESQDRNAAADQIAEDQMTIASMGGTAGALGSKAVQGLPFVGEWVDEGFNKIQPGMGDRLTALQQATDRQMPKSAVASEVAGGVVGSIAAAPAAAASVMRGANMAGRVARGAGLGLGAGASEGAISGAGAGQSGNRAKGARRGAMIGGALGAALGAVAPVAGAGIEKLVKRVKRLDVSTIADELGVSAPAARIVKSALMNDDLDAASAQLARIGDDAMLADAGEATGSLLDAAAQSGGKALRVTREATEARAGEAGTRLTATLDRVLGEADGVNDAATQISRRTSQTRQAAYTRAYGQPIDYSGAGRNIEAVLERVPPKTLNAAISEANDAMRAEGLKNAQIMAQIGDDGAVTFSEMPNVQQLDFIKRALGEIGQAEVDTFGRPTGAGIRARKLAGQLRDALSDAVPDYGRAVRLGGDKIAEDNALDMGRRLLSPKTTFEDAREVMRGASDEAKAAAKRGLREQIEQTLSNVRRTITDPNVDAREAMALVKDLSSRANLKKARLVLGTDAKALFDELEKAEAALALRAAVSRNSATAVRLGLQGAARDEAQPGLLRRALGKGGNPLDAAQELTETLAGIDPRSITEGQQALMAEIAEALVGIRGAQAQGALASIKRAMSGQPIKDQEAARIARVVTGMGAAGGYQTGEQLLEPLPQR